MCLAVSLVRFSEEVQRRAGRGRPSVSNFTSLAAYGRYGLTYFTN